MDRPATPPDLSTALEKILANPELISMVASTLGSNAPASKTSPPQEEAESEAPIPSSVEEKTESDTAMPVGLSDRFSALAPLLSSLSSGGEKGGHSKGKEDHRACLLRALKPYLNPSRREAIDHMIRLSELSDLLKHLY